MGPCSFFFKIETYPSVRLDENLLKWTKDNAAKAFSSLKQSWRRLSLTKARFLIFFSFTVVVKYFLHAEHF